MASPTSRFACGAVAALSLVIGSATAVSAAPKPSEPQLRTELKKLNTRVDKLIRTYNAKRVSLAKAQKDAKAAGKQLAAAEQTLVTAEKEASRITELRYQASTPDLPTLLFTPDLNTAALLEQMSAEQDAVVKNVAAARDTKKQAADAATALADRIRTETEQVAGDRKAAEGMIKDIEKKLQALVPTGPGRKADGSWAPELPAGSDNITPRTRLMRDTIKKTFALPFEVGCYRSGSSGEHPLGRACDFMMSSGGSMPAAVNRTLGDQIAAWAVKNQTRLGVKYVIWRQRINSGSGWRPMSDRGSITENHYDHVHVSMN
ncbi:MULTISPECIES: coiled-coil domain-containing protein [unclassified Nonomuraea]|uniref:coiled-coil domain-containing protein n=1 Tax=Nonomuraea sp. NPDC003804 TaxID=3154547 RepID=UPI0033AD5BB7